MEFEERQEAEWQRAVEKSRRTGKPMEIDTRGRPIMPRWPLVSGIVPFLFSKGVPVRWFALSLAFIAALSLLLSGLAMAMSGGMAAVGGMCIFAAGCVGTMVVAAYTASILLVIITESSDGNREIQDWPFIFDWFGDLLLFGVAGAVSAIPGWAIGKIPGLVLPERYQLLLAVSGWLFFLPIVLMSQLDINSIWGVLSGRVLKSIVRSPFTWLLFYVELAVMAAICGGATFLLAGLSPRLAIWLAPLYLAVAILFARLLGRLGWILAERLPQTPSPSGRGPG
jgi:hypothetical protein